MPDQTPEEMGERCSGRVWRRGLSERQCGYKWRVKRGGKLFCGIHDPEAVKARERKYKEGGFFRKIDAKHDAIWNEAIEAAAEYSEAKRRQALSPGRIAYYIRTLKREPKP